jgi:DnaJ-class molecular chaperone
LPDRQRHAQYDRFGQAWPQGTGFGDMGGFGGFSDFTSIFEDLCDGFGVGAGPW